MVSSQRNLVVGQAALGVYVYMEAMFWFCSYAMEAFFTRVVGIWDRNDAGVYHEAFSEIKWGRM